MERKHKVAVVVPVDFYERLMAAARRRHTNMQAMLREGGEIMLEYYKHREEFSEGRLALLDSEGKVYSKLIVPY